MRFIRDNNNIFITLTYKCNAYCKKCMTRHHVKRQMEMSTEIMNRILYLLRKNAYKGVISIGTGEALLYSDFEYFVENVLRINKSISLRILTNGSLLSSDLPSIFFDERCKWGITFDGFSQGSLIGLQDGIEIEKIKSNIQQVVEKYGADCVYLNFTTYQTQYKDMIDFCKYALKLGIREVYLTKLKVYDGYEERMRNFCLIEDDEFLHTLEQAEKLFNSDDSRQLKYDFFKIMQNNKCYLRKRVSPIIDVDGEVTFCSGREDVFIGNIMDEDIANKWEQIYDSLILTDNMWCSHCHDNKNEKGIYNLPKTIKPDFIYGEK